MVSEMMSIYEGQRHLFLCESGCQRERRPKTQKQAPRVRQPVGGAGAWRLGEDS